MQYSAATASRVSSSSVLLFFFLSPPQPPPPLCLSLTAALPPDLPLPLAFTLPPMPWRLRFFVVVFFVAAVSNGAASPLRIAASALCTFPNVDDQGELICCLQCATQLATLLFCDSTKVGIARNRTFCPVAVFAAPLAPVPAPEPALAHPPMFSSDSPPKATLPPPAMSTPPPG